MQRLWWLNLIRGIVALIVGILILGWPTIGSTLFVNFLAIFWLTSGLMSLQWGVSMHQRRGLWLVAGIVGTLVGAALLLRFVYQRYLDPAQAVRILGALALFVGLINILGGFRTPEMTREQSIGRLLLGVFEVGLGVLLIIIDAASTGEQTACWGLGVYWRDSTHPPGLPDAHSTQGETCGLNEQVLTENDTLSLSYEE
jgi:uncharacterized membrane protein HdeD (DUF308 family)